MKKIIKKSLSTLTLMMLIFSNFSPSTFAEEKTEKNTKKIGIEKPIKELSLKNKFKGNKLKKVKNTLEKNGKYEILIKSEKEIKELEKQYKNQDKNVKIKEIGNDTYKLEITKNSELGNNFGKIQDGIIPESIGGEEILEPEIFESFDYLNGEQTDKLWYLEKIKANTYQEELSTKNKIKVGILDTGIDSTQNDLKDNFDTNLSYDFINESTNQTDQNGHGTQISGIIGAKVNGAGTYGVNSNANLVSLKVLDQDGLGTSYDVIEAINYAITNNIKILNLSFGGTGTPETSPVCEAIKEAKQSGTFVVVSAGNTSENISNIVPAGCADAIVVGSYDEKENKTSFSNYGNGVIYAPGENVYTTNINNTYVTKNGTSYSTAIVTGLISKELAYNETQSYDELLSNVKNNYSLNPSPLAPLPEVEGDINDSTGSVNTNTGIINENTSTGLTLSGSLQNQEIDFNKVKYYSGYFEHNGETYGNSLYDDNYNFTNEELKGVKVYTYEEYKKVLKDNQKDFSAMSVPTNGLVGSWDLNGNAQDSSGYGNHGTAYNLTWVNSGGNYKVASFNGSNSYINIQSYINGESTISYWTKSNSYKEILGQSSDNGYLLYHSNSNGKLKLGTWMGGYSIQALITSKDYNNDYLMITARWVSGYKYDIFINGIYEGQINDSSGAKSRLFNRIGLTYDGHFLNGKVGLLKIYNRALTTQEIQQLYQDGQEKILGKKVPNNTTQTNVPQLTGPLAIDQTKMYSMFNLSTEACKSNEATKNTNTATIKANEQAAGDPVNLSTGEFDYTNTFMSIPGERQPYEFKLTYKNQTYYNGPVGIKWDHNYNKYLVTEDNENQLYYNGNLGVFRFLKNTDGTYQYNLGLKATLTNNNGQYQLTYDNGNKEYFNTDKKLEKQQDQYQNELNYTYSGGLLSQVTDTLGRHINYTYNNNRLTKVTDFKSNKVELTYYDGTTNSGSLYDLKQVTINNNGNTKTIKYEYDQNNNLTKLIDSKGQTYVTNTYTNDKVLTQTYGDGTITYNYTLSGTNITKNTVTNKVGNTTDYYYDTNGNNTSTVYHTTNGNLTYTYTYDTNGYMTTLTKPNGNGTTYEYDTRGNILEKRQKTDTTQANNNTNDLITTYTYNTRNQILTETPPNGIITTNTYDTNGNLTQTTTSGLKKSNLTTYTITKTYEYNTKGELTKATDANGTETIFSYSGGLLTQTTSGTGTNTRTTTFTYNDYGILTSKTDPRGNTTNYQITNFNQIGTGTTAEGIIKSYVYDANNNTTKETNHTPTGNKETSYSYDILDNPTQITIDLTPTTKQTTNIVYDANGNIIEKQTGNGATTTYKYNEFSKVTEERIKPNPNDNTKDLITTYTYDNNTNLTSKTDPRGNIITYTYDLYDRLKRTTKPDGTNTRILYNQDNTIAQISEYDTNDTLLTKTQYVYNGAGKIVKEITYKDLSNNTGAIIQNTNYDNNGNTINKTDAKGNTTTFTYDEFNNLTQTQDAKNNKVINTYDKNNNVVEKKIIQSNGKTTTTSYTYDKDNRLKTETNNQNKTKSYTYNKLNQITSIQDEEGNTTTLSYDYAGNIRSKTQTTTNGNITTNYTYDERGNMTSVTDANGNTTTYEYNNLNQLTKTKYPNDKEITYSYDKVGNLKTQTDPNGNITTNTYDNLNRLTSKTIQTGTGVLGVTSESYTYDNLNRLTQANDTNNHKLNFSYDSLNRLTSESQSGANVSYTYDDNNNLLTITNPENKVTAYTYDELNRLTNIGFSGSLIASYTYTGILNNVTNLGNNTSILKTYDTLNRLSSLNNGVKSYNYTYDDVGNITSDSHKNYTYDQIYRLTQVNETNSGTLLESFSFDKVGNRLTDTDNNDYTSNDLNQYTSLSGTTNKSFIYDDNGNLTSNGEKNFVYDYKNRLIKVENESGIIAEFSYDVLGRRYEKKTNSETTKYVYSNENILTEYKTNNGLTTKKQYINGLGTDNLIAVEQEESDLTQAEKGELNFCNERVLPYENEFNTYSWTGITERCNELSESGTILTTNRYYFSKNHLGSIDGITDNNGNIVTTYEYDSYGNFSLSGSDIGNTRLFTSREYDEEIGLYYFRARYYDSELGRFISRDPIDIRDDINLYSYVKNNPINYNDPSGLGSKPAIADTISNIVDLITNIDWDKAQYNVGEGLVIVGGTVSAATAPACASSVSITTTCVGVTGGLSLATGGAGTPSMSVCIPSGVTAGASCLATAGGGAVAGFGNYMMNSSGNGGNGDYNYKQDKQLSNGEIKKLEDAGYDIHKLKPKSNGSKFDLFKTKDGEVYFKRKTGKGDSETNFIDININNL